MLNFVKKGKGKKTLVFLHGWGGLWQSWGPIIERLQSKFTIYALDLPGFGQSPLPSPYTLSDYVADIAGFFSRQAIKKPVLVGHSFGGQVAAEFAIEKGKLLSGLVLVDAATARRNDASLRLDIKVAHLGRNIFQMTPLSRFYPKVRKLYYRLRGMETSDYLAITSPFLSKTASRIFREDLMAEVGKIKVPTLIFWGEKDPPELTPVVVAKKLHQEILGSKLVVVPGAGHFSYLDDQERFCAELEKFV